MSKVEFHTIPNDDEVSLKCLVLGEQNVGKTSMLGTLIDERFDSQSAPTIGIDFRVLRAVVDETPMKLQIWDSAGQYRFRSIVSSYFRLAQIFIIVFDLTDRESFLKIRDWRASVDNQVGDTRSFLVYLIGNKLDVIRDRVIDFDEIKRLAYELNFDGYYEISAKNKVGLNTAFESILIGANDALKKNIIMEAKPVNQTLNLKKNENQNNCKCF